jgi:hypothetical protein
MFYVEIGTQDGTECNTRLLREHHAWDGILIDAEFKNPDINLY